MSITFNRPAETQPSSGHVGKTAHAHNKSARVEDTSAQPAPAPRGDNVQLSSHALQIQQLSEKLSSSPETVDTEKVARLKAAIESGSYNVDSRQLADRMLELEATFN